MATKNNDATRYFSDMQEKRVVAKIGGHQTANSGAGMWAKGDVVIKEASMLIECKTPMSTKKSISIQKDWIDKNRMEAKETRLMNTSVCVCFEPEGENFFLIDEKLMKYLVEKLSEEEE